MENANSSDGLANGTVTGTATYSDGKVGQAISLDGSTNSVTLPSNAALCSYTAITLSTWVSWKGGKAWQRIFDFGNSASTTKYMFLTPTNGSYMRFAIRNGGSEQIVQTSAPLTTNTWVHVALTLGNGTATLYVNGVASDIRCRFDQAKSLQSEHKLHRQKQDFTGDPLFNGLIDDFRIYNRVLSSDEIKGVYNKASFDSTLLSSQKNH